MKKKLSAFTLLEAMVILAIISILLVLGMPGIQNIRVNSGMTTITNDMVAALHYARSEAIKRGDRVIFCASKTSMDANPSCGTEADWAEGWLVFHDPNNDALYSPGTDTILKRFPSTSLSGITITPLPYFKTDPKTITNYISFTSPRGEPQQVNTTNQSGIFRICDGGDYLQTDAEPPIRGVMLSVSGRIYSSRDSATLGDHVTCKK